MKYLVETLETELWNRRYEVEANSKDEAIKILKDWDDYPYSVQDYSEKYVEITNIEYLKAEPYEN